MVHAPYNMQSREMYSVLPAETMLPQANAIESFWPRTLNVCS